MERQPIGGIRAAQIQKSLHGLEFPADKNTLLEHAKRNGAPREVLKFIEELPTKPYESANDVTGDQTKREH